MMGGPHIARMLLFVVPEISPKLGRSRAEVDRHRPESARGRAKLGRCRPKLRPCSANLGQILPPEWAKVDEVWADQPDLRTGID